MDVHQTTKLLEVETFGCLMGKGMAGVMRKGQISRASKSSHSFSTSGGYLGDADC